MKKTLAMILAVVMLMTACVAGTLAWLQDKTDPVVNTFTVGNIDITLAESDSDDADTDANNNSYKMVPGNTISKDPKVTVEVGSEACWVFVKIVESTTLDTYITYTVAEGWTALDAVDGVYYREQAALTAENATAAVYSVLSNNQVTVKSSVTKDQMDVLNKDGAVQPTLTFTAYAVQKDNVADAAAAWAIANPTT